MIRVQRPEEAPAVLTRRGAAKCRASCEEFDHASADYRSGAKTFEHDAAIYAHQSVKQSLVAMQHDKCAFCESKVSAITYGDVEHFRPKAGYQQSRDDDLQRPGYYWLAYEWSNLFFACSICNQQGKRNLFPLTNPRRRATCHREDIGLEKPLLIDPAKLDPELFVGFREEVAFPRGGKRCGKVTIDVLGLNREALREKRRDYLSPLLALKNIRKCLVAEISRQGDMVAPELNARLNEIDMLFASSRTDSAEFAAMARCALD